MAEGHKWRPLSDLPATLEAWRDPELDSLARVWRRQKSALASQERIDVFNRELEREWAIETGIIEGVYTLDRGITQTLIERGIDSSYIPHDATNCDPELVARIIQGHKEALEGIFAFVRGERELGTSYIKELHVALLQYVDKIVVFDQFGKPFETKLDKGEYKKLSNNPRREDGRLHEYCPPEHVASEMDRLIELHREHRTKGIAPHVEAAWLHHAFTQIHPFQDGNGRVARALASQELIRDGRFPLVVTRDDRTRYIDALEIADAGDVGPFVSLVAELQRRTLKKGIARAIDAKPAASVEDALAITREMLVGVGLAPSPMTQGIVSHTDAVLGRVAAGLQVEFGSSGTFVFEYFPGVPHEGYMRSSTLNLRGPERLGQIIVMQPIPRQTDGDCWVSVVADFLSDTKTTPLADGGFQVDYGKPANLVLDEYAQWLNRVIIRGLAEWRRTLV